MWLPRTSQSSCWYFSVYFFLFYLHLITPEHSVVSIFNHCDDCNKSGRGWKVINISSSGCDRRVHMRQADYVNWKQWDKLFSVVHSTSCDWDWENLDRSQWWIKKQCSTVEIRSWKKKSLILTRSHKFVNLRPLRDVRCKIRMIIESNWFPFRGPWVLKEVEMFSTKAAKSRWKEHRNRKTWDSPHNL